MPNKWLVIDATYLCYRAYHAMGQLSYRDQPTGMVYGFLKDLVSLQDLFQTNLVAFCWDYGRGKREDMYPSYKSSRRQRRREYTPEEKESFKSFQKQMHRIRKKYLPDIGRKNNYWQEGYEADDLIAHFKKTVNPKSELIIVSADQDLYQLLCPRTMIWNPHKNKPVTADSFRDDYGIEPTQWIDVKAIAGCSTDDVDGIRGIGEKTAIKFITGNLKPKSKSYEKIVNGNDIWRKNLPIVTLPLPGLKKLKLKRDKTSKQGWNRLCRELGIKSM